MAAESKTLTAIQSTIRFTLNDLPEDHYGEDVCEGKVDAVWQFVFTRYQADRSVEPRILDWIEVLNLYIDRKGAKDRAHRTGCAACASVGRARYFAHFRDVRPYFGRQSV